GARYRGDAHRLQRPKIGAFFEVELGHAERLRSKLALASGEIVLDHGAEGLGRRLALSLALGLWIIAEGTLRQVLARLLAGLRGLHPLERAERDAALAAVTAVLHRPSADEAAIAAPAQPQREAFKLGVPRKILVAPLRQRQRADGPGVQSQFHGRSY